MNQEEVFIKTIASLIELGKKQGNVIGKEQMDEILSPLAFSKEQVQLVESYLKDQKIGIDEQLSPEDFMTTEEISYLEVYLESIGTIKQPTDGEKQAITLSAMAGDLHAANRIVEIYLSKVVEIAKLYVGEGAYIEDLIGEGNVSLTIASKSLGCLESSDEAEGFIGKMIMDSMEEYLDTIEKNEDELGKVLKRMNRVLEVTKELGEKLERKVTIEEIEAESDLSEEDVMEALAFSDELKDYIIGEI